MLKSLDELGYSLEWRVINAADYGAAQRRRRVFLFAFHKSTKYYKTVTKLDAWIFNNGLFAKSFPIEATPYQNRISEYTFDKSLDLVEVSNTFSFNFYNTGILHRGKILTIHTTPIQEKAIILKNILEDNVDKKFFLTQDNITKHKYLKGSKKIKRTRPNGKTYFYSEGSMNFPDSLEKPGRTMLTSEGTINRSSHVIKDPQTGIIRKITPVEAERLNGFPDNWTNTGMTDRQRYFMMGNALVVPIVTKIGKTLSKIVDNE
jgi:DNA (cytosine-5)-methyltransferase 1